MEIKEESNCSKYLKLSLNRWAHVRCLENRFAFGHARAAITNQCIKYNHFIIIQVKRKWYQNIYYNWSYPYSKVSIKCYRNVQFRAYYCISHIVFHGVTIYPNFLLVCVKINYLLLSNIVLVMKDALKIAHPWLMTWLILTWFLKQNSNTQSPPLGKMKISLCMILKIKKSCFYDFSLDYISLMTWRTPLDNQFPRVLSNVSNNVSPVKFQLVM